MKDSELMVVRAQIAMAAAAGAAADESALSPWDEIRGDLGLRIGNLQVGLHDPEEKSALARKLQGLSYMVGANPLRDPSAPYDESSVRAQTLEILALNASFVDFQTYHLHPYLYQSYPRVARMVLDEGVPRNTIWCTKLNRFYILRGIDPREVLPAEWVKCPEDYYCVATVGQILLQERVWPDHPWPWIGPDEDRLWTLDLTSGEVLQFFVDHRGMAIETLRKWPLAGEQSESRTRSQLQVLRNLLTIDDLAEIANRCCGCNGRVPHLIVEECGFEGENAKKIYQAGLEGALEAGVGAHEVTAASCALLCARRIGMSKEQVWERFGRSNWEVEDFDQDWQTTVEIVAGRQSEIVADYDITGEED